MIASFFNEATLCLANKALAGILQKENVWADTAKMLIEAWYDMYRSPGTQSWQWWECVFSPKLFLSPHVSKIGQGLLTGTSTQRSETGWSLQHRKACMCLLKQQNGGSD